MTGGSGAYPGNRLTRFVDSRRRQREDVSVAGSDLDRSTGQAGKRQRDMPALERLRSSEGTGDAVVAAFVIDGFFVRPQPLQKYEILVDASETFFIRHGISAVGIELHPYPAAAQLIECGKMLGGDHRRHGADAMVQKNAQTGRVMEDERCQGSDILACSEAADGQPVDAGDFRQTSQTAKTVPVDLGACFIFREGKVCGMSDEFDLHCNLLHFWPYAATPTRSRAFRVHPLATAWRE
jgi:hypothetical protein